MQRQRKTTAPRTETAIFRHNRAELEAMRHLERLTVEQFHTEMDAGFPALPEQDRRRLRSHLRRESPPTHATFWRRVARAVEVAGTDRREALAQISGPPLRPEWEEPARTVIGAVYALRKGAGRTLADWLRPYRDRWNRRDAQHDVGLICLVRDDGLHETWVRDAIHELRRQQLDGNPARQGRATAVLREVAKAVWQIGKGPPKMLTPEERRSPERRAKKREQTDVAKLTKRLVTTYEKQLQGLNSEHFTPQVVASRVVRKFKRDKESQLDPATLRRIKRGFYQRIGVKR